MSDSTRECTLICPYYRDFTHSEFDGVTITLLVLWGLGLVVTVVIMVPLLVMKGALRFPRYYLPITIVGVQVLTTVMVFGYFFGLYFFFFSLFNLYFYFFFLIFFYSFSGSDYICDGEENMEIALPNYLDSAGCLIQGYDLLLKMCFYFFFFVDFLSVLNIGSYTPLSSLLLHTSKSSSPLSFLLVPSVTQGDPLPFFVKRNAQGKLKSL